MKKNNVDLSIIVPVYNTEKYLHKCLDSLLNQDNIDGFNYEIICVNDKSPDNSEDILELYRERGIKVITHLENKGPGGAKNSGIKKASGRYVGFVDSDDWISSNYIKEISKVIIKEPVKIMFSYKKITDRGNFTVKLNKNDLDDFKYSCIIPSPWTKIYKKENLKLFKYEKEKYEDLKYIIDEIKENKIKEVFYIDKPLYNYNQLRNDNIMSEKVNEEDMMRIFNEVNLNELNFQQKELICEIMIIRLVLYGVLQKNGKLLMFFIKKIFLEYNIFKYILNLKYSAGLFYEVKGAKGLRKYRI